MKTVLMTTRLNIMHTTANHYKTNVLLIAHHLSAVLLRTTDLYSIF